METPFTQPPDYSSLATRPENPLRALSSKPNFCLMKTPFLFCLLPSLAFAAGLPSVPAPRQPVTNSFESVQVIDNYQWLEDASAAPVKEWTHLQNERTRGYFDRLWFRNGIAQQLMQLRGEESARYYGLE